MTCRHGSDDRSCSNHPDNIERARLESLYAREEKMLNAPVYATGNPFMNDPVTPDKYKYHIIDAERVGPHLVLKVEYPNCKKCSYEGKKVMVFLNVSEKDVLKWREIDPHFRQSFNQVKPEYVAPSPACRFPASPDGWSDAIAYARGKVKG